MSYTRYYTVENFYGMLDATTDLLFFNDRSIVKLHNWKTGKISIFSRVGTSEFYSKK